MKEEQQGIDDVSSSYQHTPLSTPKWVLLCRVLWKIIAFLGTTVLLGAVANILATWLTSSKGTIPANSPLAQFLTQWPIILPIGGGLLLLASLIWALSRGSPREIALPSLQYRTHMLKLLHSVYCDLLAQSLQGAAWLELGLAEKPDAVFSVANLLLHTRRQLEHYPPPGVSIQQVYTRAQGELLILGEPGGGKSTLLLSLATWLVE